MCSLPGSDGRHCVSDVDGLFTFLDRVTSWESWLGTCRCAAGAWPPRERAHGRRCWRLIKCCWREPQHMFLVYFRPLRSTHVTRYSARSDWEASCVLSVVVAWVIGTMFLRQRCWTHFAAQFITLKWCKIHNETTSCWIIASQMHF